MPVSRIEKLTERTGVQTQLNSRMEGVIDKDQRLSEGRVEAEDDTEVELLLPWKSANERGSPGADIRDLPEESGSGRTGLIWSL